MLFKLFDEDGSGGKADKQPVDDPNKQVSKDQDPDPNKEEQPGKEPEKQPDKDDGVDYKAKFEELDKFHRDYKSTTTGKLQELADIKKEQETHKPKEDDDLARIDKRIGEVDKQIPLYQNHVDELGRPARLDTTSLEASKDALLIQRKRIIEDKHAQAVSAQVASFRKEHKDLKNSDFDALTDIMQDAENKGQSMGLYAAYEIYSRDLAIAKAKESKDIDDETRDLSGKALGQDGKPVPVEKGTEGFRKADVDFYTDQLGSKDKAIKMLQKLKK